MMTFPNMLGHIAKFLCFFAARLDVKLIPAMCFISTHDCMERAARLANKYIIVKKDLTTHPPLKKIRWMEKFLTVRCPRIKPKKLARK